MRKYHVYMLQCADGSFYIGITNDLDLRVWQHNEGIDTHCYTYLRRPATLVYATEFDDPNNAITWEKKLKGWSRKKKQALVDGNWERLKELSRRKIF